MKWVINLFLITALCISLNGCTNLETSEAQIKKLFGVGQTTAQKNALMQQDNKILSNDYVIAKQTLDKAISERDEATLRLGLKKGSPPFKKDIVEAVRNAWYQSFVPDLIATLEENQDTTGGGTGNTVERQKLKKAVVSALMHLTGLRFPNTEELSKDDVQKILAESREWYRANEAEIQQTVIAEMLERQQATPILSSNYNVAKSALDKAVLEKNKNTISLGLKSPILSIRKKTVEVIAKFNDETFVPNLIAALQENQGIIGGGSEIQSLQNELNEAIISTLEQLTKLKFKVSEPLSPEDIQKILKESREWWKIHQSKDK